MSYIMTLMSLLAADSIIKYQVEKGDFVGEKPVADGKIVIKRYHNRGAMMNIGDKNQYLIALLSLVFSAFVTGIFVATLGRKGKGILKTGLALILGGAYSNTYDRLRRKYVVDYFSVRFMKAEKCKNRFFRKLIEKCSAIVFNLADFGIIIGAFLLVLGELGSRQD
ncbi:MAG: signal peptidase II [Lachnospiraceae bacterium]|nr:signal peptidase II [Lachnospiraceae bacterium]